MPASGRRMRSLCRRLGVHVLVDDDAGVQQDDRPPLGEPLDDVVDELAVLRGVGERVAEVETDGGELRRGAGSSVPARPTAGGRRGRGSRAPGARPARRCGTGGTGAAGGGAHRRARSRRRWRRAPARPRSAPATCFWRPPVCAQSSSVCRRKSSGGDVVEDVHVAPRQALVPGRRAAPGDDGDVGGRDSVLLEEPVQERDPVQDLEADLAEPGADDDVSVGGADRRQRLADQLLGAAGDRGVDELWVVGRHLDGLRPRRAHHLPRMPRDRRACTRRRSSSARPGRGRRGGRGCPIAVLRAVERRRAGRAPRFPARRAVPRAGRARTAA